MTDSGQVVYCKRCAAEVGAEDAACGQCGASLGEDPAADAPDGRWWLGLLVHPVTFFAAFGLGFVGGIYQGLGDPVTGAGFLSVSGVVELLGIVVGLVLAPVAVHFDRQYLAVTADWTPSRLAYLAAVPYLGILVSFVYLGFRHRSTR